MADRCLLYYITDRSQFRCDECARRRDLLGKIAEAARAGVDYIQLREKDLRTRELEMLAREVVAIVRENSSLTRLLINSRTDVALAAGADGVHLLAAPFGFAQGRLLKSCPSQNRRAWRAFPRPVKAARSPKPWKPLPTGH